MVPVQDVYHPLIIFKGLGKIMTFPTYKIPNRPGHFPDYIDTL